MIIITASVATSPPYSKRLICPVRLKSDAAQNTLSEFRPSRFRNLETRGSQMLIVLKEPANSAVNARL